MELSVDRAIDYMLESVSLPQILDKWREQGVTVFVIESGDSITVHSLIVPRDRRKQGIGSRIMEEIIAYADQVGKRVDVSPGVKDPYHGTTSHGRLVKFYKRFGFVRNRGWDKDYGISSTMYRPVKGV